MKLLEHKFDEIIKNFKSRLNLKASYSILGSALFETPILLLGNNWGGDENQESQIHMPLVSDILTEPNNPTYSGYIKFFTEIFNGDKGKVIQFLNIIVYTNSNFVRTPNENTKYAELLKKGKALSEEFLLEIIEAVNPSIIICFGNSDDSATSTILKILDENNEIPFWKLNPDKVVKTRNKWNTYQFKIESNSKCYHIYSFPHSSRYNSWKEEISKNGNFKSLQKQIKSVFN